MGENCARVMLGFFALVAFSGAPALADSTISTQAVSQPTAPISFRCISGFSDSAIPRFYFGTDFAFTILGEETATAVEFHFDIYDAFGDKIGQVNAQKTGEFSPGVMISPKIGSIPLFGGVDGVWEFRTVNAWPNADSAKCSVTAIRWMDGSVWRPTPVVDAAQQLIYAEGTACGDYWKRRLNHGKPVENVMLAVGGSCERSALGFEAKGYFVAAARDRARAAVGYAHVYRATEAAKQQKAAEADLVMGAVPPTSTLHVIVESPLLDIDGAAADSPLNDAPAVSGTP